MAEGSLQKSDSTKSFTSDMLDDEEKDEEVISLEYENAPWDIVSNLPELDGVVVAKEGCMLPYRSNYYKFKDGSRAVKFEVSTLLEVSVTGEKELKRKEAVVDRDERVSEMNLKPGTSSSDHTRPSPAPRVLKPLLQSSRKAPTQEAAALVETFDEEEIEIAEKSAQKGKNFRSLGEFLSSVDDNFVEIVIGGMEAGLRKSMKEKLINKDELNVKENMGVVHSINQVVFDEYGPRRPDKQICQSLSEVLKDKYPQTFRVEKAVKTSFGTLKIKKGKGEGGNSALAKRLGDNFYSKFTSKSVTPSSGVDGSLGETSPAATGSKKSKKVYGVSAEKYNYGVNASTAEQEVAKEMFKKLSEVESFEERRTIIIASRAFLQHQFKSLQPSQAVEDLSSFWAAGPEHLSEWFEWIVGGSKDGNLSGSVDMQMSKVVNILEQYIVFKKGADFETEIAGVKEMVQLHHGNDCWYKIFLIRDLGKLFKNKPEKLIFVDGSDDVNTGPNEQQPNVFVTKQNVIGEEEFDEKVNVSLRVGLKVIYTDLSLSQALAGCIQLYFCFHSYYPEDADDLYQVVQRICCNFGDWLQGANNKKGTVKKCFRDFEVCYSHSMHIFDNLFLGNFVFLEIIRKYPYLLYLPTLVYILIWINYKINLQIKSV